MDNLSDPPKRVRETAASSPTSLTTEMIAKAAIESARSRAEGLLGAGDLIGGLRSDVNPEALIWLADKLREDIDNIMTDLDHAQFAAGGEVYEDTIDRFNGYYRDAVPA